MNKDTQNNWVEEIVPALQKANGTLSGRDIDRILPVIMKSLLETEQRAYQRALEFVTKYRKLAIFGNDDEEVNSYEMAFDDIEQAITDEMNQHSKN